MILITGGLGQLGKELCQLLDEQGVEHVATDSQNLDITNEVYTRQFINDLKPSVIYHCAAYTAVDKAEEDKETNDLVNYVGTKNVAAAAEEVGATLVYISTDYVFDGTRETGEYAVDDVTNPINEYGKAKLAGERAVEETMLSGHFYIIRTSWVFGEFGANFVYTMERLAKDRNQLTVVDDQFGRPTWTKTLADFIVFATSEKIPFGTYHLSNDNSCSWFEFAREILKDNDSVEVLPVSSDQFPQVAKRPVYSILDLSKTKATGFKIPTWQEALNAFQENIKK